MLVRRWNKRNSHLLLMGMQNGTPLWKMAWQFLIKPNMLLPYDLAITLLDIYPKELKTCFYSKNLS